MSHSLVSIYHLAVLFQRSDIIPTLLHHRLRSLEHVNADGRTPLQRTSATLNTNTEKENATWTQVTSCHLLPIVSILLGYLSIASMFIEAGAITYEPST